MKLTISRRERAMYIGMFASIIFAFMSYQYSVPIIEAATFWTPVIGLVAWYIKSEENKKSIIKE